jgi:ParB family chromosome partitioning protein
MANHKKALGRGLSAILSNPNTDITQSKSTTETQVAVGGIGELLISTIEVNPFQPRTHFDETTLNYNSSKTWLRQIPINIWRTKV